MTPNVQVVRSGERFHTQLPWLDSHHSFSFGGALRSEEHASRAAARQQRRRRETRTGFRTHPHEDMEIVTWVLDGELEHKDSEGNRGILYPGLAQRMSAGRVSGIRR